MCRTDTHPASANNSPRAEGTSASAHRGKNHERAAFGHRRVESLLKADVLRIDVDVDVLSNVSLFGQHPIDDPRMFGGERR